MRSRRELEFQRSWEGFSWPIREGHPLQTRHHSKKEKEAAVLVVNGKGRKGFNIAKSTLKMVSAKVAHSPKC